MQRQAKVRGVDAPNQKLNAHQRQKGAKNAKRHRLKQELDEDEGVFGTDGLLDANDFGALAYGHEHDVRDAEAPHKDGKHGDEPSSFFQVVEDPFKECGDKIHVVQVED